MSALDRPLIGTTVLALGIVAGGYFAGSGFVRAKQAERYVTVKGVAEQEAKANLAIWPLRMIAADNDLTTANARLQTSVRRIRAFLGRHGVDTTQLTLQEFVVRSSLSVTGRRTSTTATEPDRATSSPRRCWCGARSRKPSSPRARRSPSS